MANKNVRRKRQKNQPVYRNKGWVWIFVAAFLIGAVRGDGFKSDVSGGAVPWTSTKFLNDAKDFQFAIVCDRTGGARPGVFESAVEKVNLLRPEFVLCVGDLIQGYVTDEAAIGSQWDEFEGIVGKLKMPFFYLAGNHDIGNSVMLKCWNQRRGRPYYHFLYQDVLFLCLDSEGGMTEWRQGQLGGDQLAYFETVLKANASARWTVVMVHEPMWCYEKNNWGEFEKLLAGRRYTVFSGHQHQNAYEVRGGNDYIRLGLTGGVMELGGMNPTREERIHYGIFDQLVWVTMTDDGPEIAVLALDGIYDKRVVPAAMADFLKKLRAQFKKKPK